MAALFWVLIFIAAAKESFGQKKERGRLYGDKKKNS